MKEIRVTLYSHENDAYNELYRVIDGDTKQKYFARYTCNNGTWYFVSDPLGYCELSHPCPENYVFVVCTANGKELFKDSNGEIRNPFPTFEQQAIMEWDAIKENYPTKEGKDTWLQSFITKDMKEKLKDEPCLYNNWTLCWISEIKKESIKEFEHLGTDYCIYKVTMKHMYCDCEWIKYLAGLKKMDEGSGYGKYFGEWYDDSVVGACYGNGEAIWLVADALKLIYPGFGVSRVEVGRFAVYERRMSYRMAAEHHLLKGNFEREFVNLVIENERTHKSFYSNLEEIKKDYPDCLGDNDFR